jgi:hypothetical protein
MSTNSMKGKTKEVYGSSQYAESDNNFIFHWLYNPNGPWPLFSVS